MSKVLIVEDDRNVAMFVNMALRELGYEILEAYDGQEALEKAVSFRPDLVVLDLMMPRMHGYQVCRQLRADKSFNGVKILVVSSKSYAADIDAAMQAGADAYLTKPYTVEELRAQVQSLIGSTRAAMSVRFWGTRGSLPAPGPQTTRYGGNTACTELRIGDLLIILDCGTGIRPLGDALMSEFGEKPINGHIFVGHTHWDHIQGFPFFYPLYVGRNQFTVYSVSGAGKSLERIFRGQMDSDYFPVPLPKLSSQLRFTELNGPVDLKQAKVSYQHLNHPGVTIGFRVESEGRVVTYLSDHEPFSRLSAPGGMTKQQDDAIVEFARASDLLICEAQYTEEEYQLKRGWGHSTFDDVVQRAVAAGVKQLALFHHDPSHTDEMMDTFVARCRSMISQVGSPVVCFGAQEGQTLIL